MSYQHYFQTEHDQIRQITRRFVEREMMPFVDAWEEAGSFPRELYQKAAKVGILGMGYPEALGGTPGDLFMQIAVWEELMRPGSGGLSAGLGSLHIALPPILALGSPEQQERFIRPVLAGLQTTAVLQNDHYIVNGSKTFITSGCRADLVTTAVRTGGPGSHGISLLVIEADTPGFSKSQPLKKMGWWASDTAQLFFDDCRVPAGNLIGPENRGFYAIMANFQKERLQMSIVANMTAELALAACLEYVQQREAFGRPIAGFQVMRHKLVDMATELE
ncbi:MAG: acyl-CoA dehydrogenase family protein, partial [Anaerolineales bacterium]|nr:acyl-CoA dehydrogenase family protein [Anaerolineales bacterium]